MPRNSHMNKSTDSPDQEIKFEYLAPVEYTPTQAELLAQIMAGGCVRMPTRYMTREELEAEYPTALQQAKAKET